MDGLLVRSEKIEFDPSQLLACEACGRSNAPNRAECIYCGAELPAAPSASAELRFREVEPWEKAFNIVTVDNIDPEELSAKFALDADFVRRASELGPPVPLLRVPTAGIASELSERLNDANAPTIVVSDEELNADQTPVRLRSLSVLGTLHLTTFNTNERFEFPSDMLRLVVVGRLFEERSEQTLKKKRGGAKEIDGRSVSKDASVIDIYFSNESNGFRITESGFDFSGLCEQKSFLASENMKKLVEQLRAAAPSAAISADYVSKRNILENIWPSVMRIDSKGVQRANFGLTVEKAEVTTNLEQFTKYSRLVSRTI